MRRLLACLMVSAATLLASAPAQAAHSDVAHAHPASSHRVVTFMSQAEYEQAVQRGTAHYVAKFMRADGPVGRAPAKPVAWYQILFSATDWSGIYIPTRQGTSSFGYSKINSEHNLYNLAVINAPYHGYADDVSGTRRAYIGYALINGEPVVQIKSIADTSYKTGVGVTPDGKIVGTITSYCVGYVLCPSWING